MFLQLHHESTTASALAVLAHTSSSKAPVFTKEQLWHKGKKDVEGDFTNGFQKLAVPIPDQLIQWINRRHQVPQSILKPTKFYLTPRASKNELAA